MTEGIISTIPVKFRLQSYVKHYPQTNFPKFRLDLTLLGVGFRWVCLKSGLDVNEGVGRAALYS